VFDSPDPWMRDPESPPLDQNVYERCTGREIVEKQIDGSLPRAPLADLIGLEPVSAGDGVVEVKMPAHPWLSNHMMGIHGGFLATMADSAMQMAIQTTTKVANRFAPLDFKINLLRPVSPDGSELKAHGSVTYRGRTNTLATAEIVNHKGKTVAVASGAAMFGPAELL
jgi:uncharacterized protein (TIGR00369 family)